MGLDTYGDLWSAKALIDKNLHHMVLKMHKDFINAGSELIVTANFSVRRRLLKRYNLLDSLEFGIKSAGEIAQKAKLKIIRKLLLQVLCPIRVILIPLCNLRQKKLCLNISLRLQEY